MGNETSSAYSKKNSSKDHQLQPKMNSSKVTKIDNQTFDTNWKEMKDWSFEQMDGFRGNDRIISMVPLVVLMQYYSGHIKTKTFNKIPVRLTDLTTFLTQTFENKNGDQNLISIETIGGKQNKVDIVFLYFDS